MILSRVQAERVIAAFLSDARRAAPPTSAAAAGQRGPAVEISASGLHIADTIARARQIPEVRAERVAAVKEALASGTYRVAPEDVAAKIVERLVTDAAIWEGQL